MAYRPASKSKGELAESYACEFLQQQGLTLVDKNYSIKQGEIDLIMRDGNYLVFVEVRLRGDEIYGTGLESISANKVKRILAAARHYLLMHLLVDKIDCRFDIISLSNTLELDWIKNAFEVEY